MVPGEGRDQLASCAWRGQPHAWRQVTWILKGALLEVPTVLWSLGGRGGVNFLVWLKQSPTHWVAKDRRVTES